MNDPQQDYNIVPIKNPKAGDWVTCRYPDENALQTFTGTRFGAYYQIEEVLPKEEEDDEDTVTLVGVVHSQQYSDDDYDQREAGEPVLWGTGWFEPVPDLVAYMLNLEDKPTEL